MRRIIRVATALIGIPKRVTIRTIITFCKEALMKVKTKIRAGEGLLQLNGLDLAKAPSPPPPPSFPLPSLPQG